MLIPSLIIIVVLVSFALIFFYYYKNKKKQSWLMIQESKDKFNEFVNLPIEKTLERIKLIAHNNRVFQVGYDVWKIEYKNDIILEKQKILDEFQTIETLFKEKTEAELLEIILEINEKIESFGQNANKFLSKIHDFIILDTIHREEITWLKMIFREIIEFFDSKRNILLNSAPHIEKAITLTENLFTNFEEAMKKADYNETKKIIIQISNSLNELLTQINIAPQIQMYTSKLIPKKISSLKENIKKAKEEGARFSEKTWLGIIKVVEEELSAIELTSKLKTFTDCETLIEKNLKKLQEIEKTLYEEVKSKRIFAEKRLDVADALKKTYAITHTIAPLINDIKRKAKLSREEQAKINIFHNKLNELKHSEGKIKEILDKQVDYNFRELLQTVSHLAKLMREILKTIEMVYDLIDQKENADLRCEREKRNLSLAISELLSDVSNNKYIKHNDEFISLINTVQEKLQKTSLLMTVKPRNLENIENNLEITRKLLDDISKQIYTTIERFNIAEKEIMWMSRYRNESIDLNQLLQQAEITFKSRQIDELEKILEIAKATTIIKKHKRG